MSYEAKLDGHEEEVCFHIRQQQSLDEEARAYLESVESNIPASKIPADKLLQKSKLRRKQMI